MADLSHNSNRNESAGELDGAYYDGIGAELRDERLRCGLALHEVASRLRIRESHLEAIEAGRFGDLPGRIYAIGFVRSYAEFLGADGDVCIMLFKAEVGPGGHSRKLVFPVPPTENRRPGLVTLAASVALAALVYGGWYVWQGDEHQSAELVPEVPQKFVEQAELARVREETAVAGLAAANASEAPQPSVSDDVIAEGSPGSEKTVTSLGLAVVGRAPAAEAALADESRRNDADEQKEAPVEVATPVPAASEATAQEPVEAEPLQVAVATPPPVPDVEPQESGVPRVYGTANRGARVLVRATGRVQIIVKNADGSTLMPHRVLQSGDVYRAPAQGDAFLQTDNPGVLQVIVDGRLVGRGDRLTTDGRTISLSAETFR